MKQSHQYNYTDKPTVHAEHIFRLKPSESIFASAEKLVSDQFLGPPFVLSPSMVLFREVGIDMPFAHDDALLKFELWRVFRQLDLLWQNT